MQAPFRPSYLIFAVAVQTLHFFTYAAAQDIDATIEVRAEKPFVAQVSGRFANPAKNLTFIRSYAGLNDLGARIGTIVLKDGDGQKVAVRPVVPGEYFSDAPFTQWSYSVDLSPRKEQNSSAHISWVGDVGGVLMLFDVLPNLGKATSAKVKIVLPSGWRQLENRIDGIVETRDAASEVVVVGKDLRFRTVHTGGTAITIGIAGEWLFTGDEITSFARDIYAKTRETFGENASKDVFVNIFKFPVDVAHGQWQAETRGRNVTLISSDMPFKSQSLQRLHEQLRHEMFHLWIPNGVNLSGNYDWFYEGFALYASLKTAVAMNQIRFEDFLDTLTRAQAIDARQTNRLSLVSASNQRWAGADTYVYARGMVTAFLCDVLLLSNSKGKRSVNDVLREFYAKHKYPNPRIDGNVAALAILQANKELIPVVERYIKGQEKFSWEPELQRAGLEMRKGLTVLPKLSGKQKDLLDALGYNNWRKLSPKK